MPSTPAPQIPRGRGGDGATKENRIPRGPGTPPRISTVPFFRNPTATWCWRQRAALPRDAKPHLDL